MRAPSSVPAVSFSAVSERGLKALGRSLADALRKNVSGPSSLLIGLDGELGTGKTTLVAGTLKALGVTSPVTSPTYGLVHPYRVALEEGGGEIEALHVDLYRLKLPSELDELGILDDSLRVLGVQGRLLFVEWFENAGGRLGAPDAVVHLGHSVSGRLVRLEAHSQAGRRIVALLRQAEHPDLIAAVE